VKCRSAPIMPERGRHTLRRILLAIGLAAASVLVPSVAALGSVASMPASPLKASPEAASDKVDSARLKAALAQLERFTTDLLRQTGVPGLAIAVVHDDRVVYLKGFGVREVGKPGSVDADTVFQLASLSKPLASTVVASVVGEGGLSWDEAVVKRLPQARIGEPAIAAKVTLRDLLRTAVACPTTPVTTSKTSDLIEARFLSACAFCQSATASAPTTPTPTSDSRPPLRRPPLVKV